MDIVTIRKNWWRVPSERHVFDGWLEGAPTAEERHEAIEAAEAARAAWKPSPEGMQLVEQLKAFIGCRIRIRFWDSCMWTCDEEAPYPTEADCLGVILQQHEGFLQAFLHVKNLKEFPTPEGYSSQGYFKPQGDVLLVSFADLYEVSKIGNIV